MTRWQNPTPEKVRDPKFRGSEFFDPHDAVQVKYEMLRRVSIDKVSVTEASDEYGVSRPTYYQAKVNFDMAGIAGLVSTKPGPRGPHKIDDKVVAFLQAHLAPGEPVRARELAKLLRQELDIELHPRSIERVLKKAAGKLCRDGGMSDPTVDHRVPVRGIAQGCSRRSVALMARSGLLLFLRRGMWGWAQALATTAITPREQNYPSSIAWPLHRGHSAVVHVLATIAMSINDRRSR